MRSYTRREVVGFREGSVGGDVRGSGVLDPPTTSVPVLVIAPALLEPRTRARVTVGKRM